MPGLPIHTSAREGLGSKGGVDGLQKFCVCVLHTRESWICTSLGIPTRARVVVGRDVRFQAT